MSQTNNQELNQIKGQANKPVITSITFYDKDNYVNFSDTDSQIDYFNSYTMGINHVIEWLVKGDAADVIKVDFINNVEEPKFYKRLNKLAKVLRYQIKTVVKRGIYRIYENDRICEINPYCYKEFYLFDSNKVKESEIKC